MSANITPQQLRCAANNLRMDAAIGVNSETKEALEVSAQFCDHVADQIEREEEE